MPCHSAVGHAPSLTSVSYFSSNLEEKVVLDIAGRGLAVGSHCVKALAWWL